LEFFLRSSVILKSQIPTSVVFPKTQITEEMVALHISDVIVQKFLTFFTAFTDLFKDQANSAQVCTTWYEGMLQDSSFRGHKTDYCAF